MSRQAVRQNIAELEKELNGSLFENRNNRLFLTGKGTLLKELAVPVMESYRKLQDAMIADVRLEHSACRRTASLYQHSDPGEDHAAAAASPAGLDHAGDRKGLPQGPLREKGRRSQIIIVR